MAKDSGLLCWSCGKPTGIIERVMRSDQCDNCMSDLRCCRGCRHFDPTRRFQCKEQIESYIGDKEKNNLCDYFQKRDATKLAGGVSHQVDAKDERKKNFDDLFKD